MSRPRLYLDEDSMDQEMVHGLRARGVDLRTANEDGMRRQGDEDQLRWAAAQRRALFSYNVGHFYRLHTSFLARGEDHGGLILVGQRRYGIREQLRAVLRLVAAPLGIPRRSARRPRFLSDADTTSRPSGRRVNPSMFSATTLRLMKPTPMHLQNTAQANPCG